MSNHTKQQLRQLLRERRQQLSAHDQRIASARLDRQLRRQPAPAPRARVAFYLANDGEISPALTLQRLTRQGRQCYLPCLNRQILVFRRHRPGQTLKRNRFNIPEPPARTMHRPAQSLDIIFMPLVGFDGRGNRLGMGGGFYDRSLGHLRRNAPGERPLLIGLAHECQRLPLLPTQPWDVPLDAIATDRGVYWFS